MGKLSTVLLLTALLMPSPQVSADAALSIAAPTRSDQPGIHQIVVKGDGSARLKLIRAATDETAQGVDLRLTTFEDEKGAKGIVTFEASKDAAGNPQPFFEEAEISEDGTEFGLAANLREGAVYSGKLIATIGPKQLTWDLQLVRYGSLPPFLCPLADEEHIVSPDGKLVVQLERSVARDGMEAVDLELLPFLSTDKQMADVVFEAADPEKPTRLEAKPVEERVLSIPLIARGLKLGEAYSGGLRLSFAKKPLITCPLKLLAPKPPQSVLVVDTNTMTRNMELPWCALWSCDVAVKVDTLRLFNKTPTTTVDGIIVRLEGKSGAPRGTFNLRNLSFLIDGKEAGNLAEWPPENADLKALRTFLVQRDLTILAQGFEPGQYEFVLRFTARNSVGSDQQKVSVTINARHHWLWAVAGLLIALTISYLLSKGIVNWRDRTRTRQKIRQMQPGWLKGYTQLPSVAWLRAVLAQCSKLASATWLLPPAPSIANLLERAARVLRILQEHRKVTEAIEAAGCADSIKHQFRESVAGVIHRIGPEPLDQSVADKIIEDFATINGRLDDPVSWYWKTIQEKAERLVTRAESLQINKLGDATKVNALINTLKNPRDDEKEKFDNAYWTLALLWSRRDIPGHITKLNAAIGPDKDMEDLYKVADQCMWERLKSGERRIKILPSDGPTQPVTREMLQPIQFTLDFNDEPLAKSFLVRNMLQYEWSFQVKVKPRFQKVRAGSEKSKQRKWTAVSNGPRIGQFAPREGELSVKVAICMPSTVPEDIVNLEAGGAIQIEANSDLRFQSSLRGSEIALVSIVTIITLLSGYVAFYSDNATFGSFADFVGLLTWAVGIDQGKNLIQALQTYSLESETTP